MEHPFINDLTSKSLEELQSTMSSLTSKLNFAHRMNNQPMVNQLQMAISSYQGEYYKQMDALVSKQNVQTKISIQKDN